MAQRKNRGKVWREITVGNASVKIYRNAEPTNASGIAFILAWKSSEGRKRQKFSDEKNAIAEARVKAAQLNSGRIESASMTTGDRDELTAARALTKGIPLVSALEEWARGREITGGNILVACEAWASRNGKTHTRVKVEVAVKEFLKAKTAAGKKVATNHASTFKKINADLGVYSIDTVTAKQLDAWLSQWEHPVTRNTNRRRLVSIWRWAQRKGYLSRDVRTEAEMTDTAHEPAFRVGIIDVATWRKLLSLFRVSHPELLPALAIAGFCGLRRSEVHSQTWEDINLERKIVRVTEGKRGTPARRLVPLCDAAVAWLSLSKERSGFVCPTVDYKGKPQPSLAMDGIRRIASKAEIDLPENAFRHSYISHRVAETGDIPRVSLDAGNSPKQINKHYRELVSKEEGEAWFQLMPSTKS